MGLSASQSRLLMMTSRMSDLEYHAQSISNSKIRLSDQSAEVSKAYADALNTQKFQYLNSTTNAYSDLTYNSLTGMAQALGAQYCLTDANDNVVVTSAQADAFKKSSSANDFLNLMTGAKNIPSTSSKTTTTYKAPYTASNYSTKLNEAQFDYNFASKELDRFAGGTYTMGVMLKGYNSSTKTYTKVDGKPVFTDKSGKTLNYKTTSDAYKALMKGLNQWTKNYTATKSKLDTVKSAKVTTTTQSTTYASSASSTENTYYTNLYNRMKKGYKALENNSVTSNADWLQSQVTSGNLSMEKFASGAWSNTSWQDTNSIVQKSDDTVATKAEAVYQQKTAEIEAKDNRFDLELKQIDTEHSAVQTEVDSVKKVIDKNIERSFKIFDA